MVSERLKQIIFKQLYKELSNVDIIPHEDSIHFIDIDKKYWYFEYEKSGELWWRHDFFTNFFILFSLEFNDYQKIMGEWVEEVLNCKVTSTHYRRNDMRLWVEEVLNCKVTSTYDIEGFSVGLLEEVLNCKVDSTNFGEWILYEEG